MPNKTLHRVDIFISSPSDVGAEREAALRAIERLNRLSYIRSKYLLNPLRYEQEVPPASGAPAQIIVDQYMLEPQDSFIVLCILWSRMGTPFTHPTTGESFESGTQYEFVMAYRSQQQQGMPHVLLYRNTSPNAQADPAQVEKVDAFFKKFHGDGAAFKGLYQTYTDAAEFEDYVFHHIEKILMTHPPEHVRPQHLENMSRPTLIEAPRRLDAALPQETSLNQPTELWAQVCLPTSKGFRDKLPHTTNLGDIIDQQDVTESSLTIAFPVNETTNRAQPVTAFLEITAPDFKVLEPRQTLLISPDYDSGVMVFSLTPVTPRKRSIIHVKLSMTTSDGHTVTVGSVTLYAEVKSPIGDKIGKLFWSMVSLPLGVVSIKRGSQPITAGQVNLTEGIQSPLQVQGLDLLADIKAYGEHIAAVDDDQPYDVRLTKDNTVYSITPQLDMLPRLNNIPAHDVGSTLLRVAHSKMIRTLSHPESHIPRESLPLSVHNLDAAVALLWESKDHSEPYRVPLAYEQQGDTWKFPRFGIKLTNLTSQTLYCAFLYVGLDSSQPLLRDGTQQVQAGQSVMVRMGGRVEDAVWQQGIYESLEYIKWIVCTHPFDVNALTQMNVTRNLEADIIQQAIPQAAIKRGASVDWQAGSVQVVVHRPAEATPDKIR